MPWLKSLSDVYCLYMQREVSHNLAVHQVSQVVHLSYCL